MIEIAEFASRRDRFRQQMAENTVAVFPANVEVTRSRDTEYHFRQDSDFHYLTGFHEPDAVLIIANGEQPQTILFCREKDKLMETWTGRRVGPEKAAEAFSFDAAYPLSNLDDELLEQINGKDGIYVANGQYDAFDALIQKTISTLRANPKKGYTAPGVQYDSRLITAEMRLIKSPAEIDVMVRSCEIAGDAHNNVMKTVAPGQYEYQVEAGINHHFAMNGARHPAYASIVGGGENACILHYTENSDVLNDGDLLLIDAGGEYQGYAADITRTIPVNGQFSEPQKKIYQLVLDAQLAAMEFYRPGATLKQASDAAIRVLTTGLVDLGLLSGDVDTLIEENAFKAFYMHGLGHWLGLDVHDVGVYKIHGEERPLEPGMVITIEPGLYISEDSDVDDCWKGIGVRIEDDILITENGHRNLTAHVPKTIDAVEAFMAEARR